MKSLKTIVVLCLLLLAFGCSSDDDSSSNGGNQGSPTTGELLRSGIWYLESKTPGGFSDCEKNGSLKFNANNTVQVESFDEDSGTCESQGVVSATYSLSGNSLTIDFDGESLMATINDISSSSMTITDNVGDVIVFDKTQG